MLDNVQFLSTQQRFSRFVALGDSQTEGVGDYDHNGNPRGWADRFALALAIDNPGLQYANLAIRGRQAARIREEQLPRALALRPDLASVIAGMNDLMRPRFDMPAVVAEVETMVTALRDSGSQVLTFTFPDITEIAPVARPLSMRIRSFNSELRVMARRTGAILIDFEPHVAIASDARVWSDDRIHLNAAGHERCAHAVAEVFGLSTANPDWRIPLPAQQRPFNVLRETAWLFRFFAPWIGRRLRGVSSGDGVTAKRPTLLPVIA